MSLQTLFTFLEHNSTAQVALLVLIATFVFLAFASSSSSTGKKKKAENVALNPEEWKEFTLLEKKELSHDVRLFRFRLPTGEDSVLGLPIGKHISLKFMDHENKLVQRSYTPTSSDDDKGIVDFIIKVYFKNTHPKFPDGGKMSQHLNDLKIGDKMLMKGPKGNFEYLGRGELKLMKNQVWHDIKLKKLGMIAGGTGITPMLQIARAILKDPKDKTEVYLLFANQTEEDIFLREELEALPRDRFHLWYTLDRPSENWKYSSGFINADMVKAHMPPPANDSLILVCGPPPMIKFACEPAFNTLGYTEDQWHPF